MIHDRNLLIKGLIIGSALIGYKVALLNAIRKRAKNVKEDKQDNENKGEE